MPANRLAAEKAWQELNPDEQLSRQILDAIHAQRDLPEWQPHPSRTLPHLKTYLRNKRWLDVKPRVVAQAVPVVPSAPVVPMPDHIRKRLGELRGRGGDAERAAA